MNKTERIANKIIGAVDKNDPAYKLQEACGKALGTGIGKSLLAEDLRSRCAERSLAFRELQVADGYVCTCCMPKEWTEEDIVIREL